MSDGNGEPALFESDAWYQLSEARVDTGGEDLTHNLNIQDSPPGFRVHPSDGNGWQFIPTDDDIAHRYHLRSRKSGTGFHLSACFHADEESDGQTRLCLAKADEASDGQKWEAYDWEEGTTAIRFINVANGTDYFLDVRKGADPFMNDDIGTDTFKPAQRWLVSSVSSVDDPAFMVSATNAPEKSSTDSPASNTADPTETVLQADDDGNGRIEDQPSAGLSTGAAAGIGVGVTAAVLLGLSAIFFILRRKRQARKPMRAEDGFDTKPPTGLAEVAAVEPAAHEVLGQTRYPNEGVSELESHEVQPHSYGYQTPQTLSPENRTVSPMAKSQGSHSNWTGSPRDGSTL